ncbi:glutathione S-transferase family protein [Acuticoccus sp. I52.16.1]|uniref:glutathione S-transferase family protein n=1 Tax=Acuticoccus sp. I52.16.1 TaxID=2928472 RepID=UPI001FD452FC|nr:glutathione S-transferase family protein [Acuticoccus sp. I52.16.1]UOM35488.1 glutathione S-transferase family protein [Acuticoccus sp. I52.16.1]
MAEASMKLVGRMLSPYVRRVAIWCALQGREIEVLPVAATDPAQADTIKSFHPGMRVPVLVLDDGTKLLETIPICDWLDDSLPDERLVPATGIPRRDCMQRIGLAHSSVEKVISLVYEKNRRPEAFHWKDWQERVLTQIEGGFTAMEALAPEAGFFGGETPDGSDIAFVCTFHQAKATNPFLVEGRYPKLTAHAERAMQIPAFAETYPG